MAARLLALQDKSVRHIVQWPQLPRATALVAAAEDELGHKIRRAPRGFTQRHAETEKIFGVHE